MGEEVSPRVKLFIAVNAIGSKKGIRIPGGRIWKARRERLKNC